MLPDDMSPAPVAGKYSRSAGTVHARSVVQVLVPGQVLLALMTLRGRCQVAPESFGWTWV